MDPELTNLAEYLITVEGWQLEESSSGPIFLLPPILGVRGNWCTKWVPYAHGYLLPKWAITAYKDKW